MKAALLVGLAVLIGSVLVGLAPVRPPDIQNYRSWSLATDRPEDMSPRLMLSCVGPRKWDSSPNPHIPRVFLVYVNPIGAKAMKAKNKVAFPDGTVIVKEKYPRIASLDAAVRLDIKQVQNGKPELLTVMAKNGGKWTYWAYGQDGKLMEGDSIYCQKCHESAKDADFVFRPYVPGAPSIPGGWGR